MLYKMQDIMYNINIVHKIYIHRYFIIYNM